MTETNSPTFNAADALRDSDGTDHDFLNRAQALLAARLHVETIKALLNVPTLQEYEDGQDVAVHSLADLLGGEMEWFLAADELLDEVLREEGEAGIDAA